MVCFPGWLQEPTPCPEAASEGNRLPQRQPHLQASLPQPSPAGTAGARARRGAPDSRRSQRARAGGREQLTGRPRSGGSGDLLCSEPLGESQLSESCAELSHHLEPVARRAGCGRVRCPSARCDLLPPFSSHFHTSIFLPIEPVHRHSQSLYLNQPFCWTRIKYSPAECDTVREPGLEARERENEEEITTEQIHVKLRS